MRGRGDAGAGHAREALAAWLKMRDGGWLGYCLVAAVDCIDVQGMILEPLDARSWRRRSRSTRACRRLRFHVRVLRCVVEEWGCGGGGDAGAGHARETLVAWLKMRDGGWLGYCLVAAVDSIDVQIIKLETLNARSWRRSSRSTRACRRLTFHVRVLRCGVEEWGCGEWGM
jgi:lysozyme family protein